jgi:hypothetical protein
MSEWTKIGRILMGCALLVGVVISCGGEPSSEPVSQEEAAQQARKDRGGTFAQLAARSQLEAHEERQQEAAAAAPAAEAPQELSPLALFAEGDGELLTELPGGFPASIGEYPGMTIEAVSADEDIVNLAFSVAEEPQSVLDTLTKRLQDEGWTLSEVVKDEGGDILSGEKGDEIATFVVMPAEGQATRIAASVVQK